MRLGGEDDGRPDPAAFPLDDRRVYDAYVAGRASAGLAAAVRVGLFDRLDRAPAGTAELARDLGLAERPTGQLLRALAATGLVHRAEDTDGAGGDAPWELALDAAAYLVRGRPGSLVGLIELEVEHFLSPAVLLEALRRDDASVYGGQDPWEAHAADPEKARAFTAAMHAISERPAAGLAEAVLALDLLGGRARLLDAGGGSGALSLALARARPELTCEVMDIPPVCALADEYAREAGLAPRVHGRPGDLFGEWPTGYDGVLLSQILHDWSPADGERLLRAAHGALRPGGHVLIHEKLVGDDDRGPLANALVHLDMLVWTRGQQVSAAELHDVLGRVGFVDVRVTPTAGYWSLVDARRA